MLNESRHAQPGLDTNLERLRLPRQKVEIGALSLSEGAEQSKIVSINLPSHQFSTHLISDLGTFITSFSHAGKSYVVRFADHGREISVLPAGNERDGIAVNQNRLFVSTIPTDLGHILLTPFSGTGIPRLLTTIAVQHALAATGHATAHVRFVQIRNILAKCGLTESFTTPIHQHERLEAEAFGREQASKGFQYNYDDAIMLPDKVVMGRSIAKEEREKNKHWNLGSHFRLLEYRDGRYIEHALPRS